MLEKTIENAFYKYAKSRGCTAEKFVSPSKRSVPDRLVTCPGGVMFFIEFKAPDKKPTPLQLRDHAKRKEMGIAVFVCDQKGQAEAILDIALMGAVTPSQLLEVI